MSTKITHKKILLCLGVVLRLGIVPLVSVLHPAYTHAQSVAINADSSLPDPSAILDLKSSIKGFLAPRMTQAQRDLIAIPAIGLLIYQTDNTPGFYYYDGASWTRAKGAGGGGGQPGSVLVGQWQRHLQHEYR
jgi:hypothetical protein